MEAAGLLRYCTLENWDIVDSWMDGNRQLDGLLIEVSCPRSTYEIITDQAHPLTISIRKALSAVLPSGTYLKSLRARAVSSRTSVPQKMPTRLPDSEIKKLAE